LKAKEKVYGFTLFLYHFGNIEFYLKRSIEKGWKVIHLYRENIFRQALSNVIAMETGFWHRHKDHKSPDYKVHIDAHKLVAELEKRIRWHRFEDELFERIDYIKINYENDLANHEKRDISLNGLLDFLNVEPCRLTSDLVKTDTRPPEEIIVNYNELMENLKNTALKYLIPKE